jgi:cytochrome c553
MTRIACWLVAVTIAFASAGPSAFPQSLGLPNPPADVPAAAKGDINHGRFVALGGMYGTVRIDCIRCHGLDGAGDPSGAFPRLSNQSGWYLYQTLQDYALDVRNSAIMQPIAKALTPKEREDVAAYYGSIIGAPFPPRPEADASTLQTGGAIAAVGIPRQGVPACNGCHGERGMGNGPVYPYLAGQFAPYLEQQLRLWKNEKRGGDPMNIMMSIAKAMSDEQIRAVSVYYASVRPRESSAGDPAPHDNSQGAPGGGARAKPAVARPPYLSVPPPNATRDPSHK